MLTVGPRFEYVMPRLLAYRSPRPPQSTFRVIDMASRRVCSAITAVIYTDDWHRIHLFALKRPAWLHEPSGACRADRPGRGVVTAAWCALCRRDHILKTCELCGADLEHGHKLIHLCEPCKRLMRERGAAAIATAEPEGNSA
jgi:hypothetical protein